jgi:hypothetical protein
MVVLLVASGYLNYYLTQKPPPIDAGNDNAITTFFATAKADRNTRRNGDVAFYDAIINSPSSTADEKSAATAAKLKIGSYAQYEADVEMFIFGKGYPASVAYCADNNINVTIADNNLTAPKVAEIKNFIIENTAYTLNQISIRSYSVIV